MLRWARKAVRAQETRMWTSTDSDHRILLWGFAASVGGLLIVYSATFAYYGDEGFHLLAAQLIRAGKKPYLDFMFPQTPLNAYWNAVLIRVFGNSWRAAHVSAAVLTAGAVALTADFVFLRLQSPRWRLVGALAAASFIGLHSIVFRFGSIGQAYGMSLFATVAAFRVTVTAAGRRGIREAAFAGFLAAFAAGASLLAASAAPVLLVWMIANNRSGNRRRKAAAFVGSAIIPFLPVAWLFIQGPRQTWFNLVEYHLRYRGGSLSGDLRSLGSLLHYPQFLTLGLLAGLGLLAIRANEWGAEHRAEFRLCGWLALFEAGEAALANPPFKQYFCLAIPFLGALAAAGYYGIWLKIAEPAKRRWALLALALLVLPAFLQDLHGSWYGSFWTDRERFARQVRGVVSERDPVWADDYVYFLTGHRPPPGLEFVYSHDLTTLSPEDAADLHVVNYATLNRMAKTGGFYAVASCYQTFLGFDEPLSVLSGYFTHSAATADCQAYWGPAPRAISP